MEISAVIPTYNRKESLLRLLKSLNDQEYVFKEVVIVDSSDALITASFLKSAFPKLNILYRTSSPSACIQRNLGIQIATASHVFLCPDDLEVPQAYLQTISNFLKNQPDIGAISGVCVEPDSHGAFQRSFPTIKFRTLFWNFLFQLTVWADLERVTTPSLAKPILAILKKFYRHRGNFYSLAGWPLVTQVNGSYFRTSLFSLGGAVIRRDWLLASPYDELLDKHGIGDNYGVTLNFPQEQPVWVIRDCYVLHHKTPVNRLSSSLTYFRRILALNYFMKKNNRFSKLNHIFLVWSLFGNLIAQLLKKQFDMAHATTKALTLILSGRNPYVLASKNGSSRTVAPMIT